LVWMFHRMGIGTGIDIDALVAVAKEGAAIPGGISGGRVRNALLANPSSCAAARSA
jgi:hydroxymethylglutaryl-CoA lyase